MVRDVDDARTPGMIVSAEEVEFRLSDHVRGRDRNVLVPGNVDARGVIDAVVDRKSTCLNSSPCNLVCRLLLEKKKKGRNTTRGRSLQSRLAARALCLRISV